LTRSREGKRLVFDHDLIELLADPGPYFEESGSRRLGALRHCLFELREQDRTGNSGRTKDQKHTSECSLVGDAAWLVLRSIDCRPLSAGQQYTCTAAHDEP
jgi:hypothetical protein